MRERHCQYPPRLNREVEKARCLTLREGAACIGGQWQCSGPGRLRKMFWVQRAPARPSLRFRTTTTALDEQVRPPARRF